jgi:hypothetical protein
MDVLMLPIIEGNDGLGKAVEFQPIERDNYLIDALYLKDA